jgi:hypothetical protein
MPRKQVPEPWKSFLAGIDRQATEKLVFHCLGGFVVTMLYGLDRPTADVDVLAIAPVDQRQSVLHLAGKTSVLHRKHKVYLEYVTVAAVPENYEERLTNMFERKFKHLRLLALDPYDLALSKLERNSQRDRDDVKYLAQKVPFDLRVLEQRYTSELRTYLGNPQREDLTLELWIKMIEEGRRQE